MTGAANAIDEATARPTKLISALFMYFSDLECFQDTVHYTSGSVNLENQAFQYKSTKFLHFPLCQPHQSSKLYRKAAVKPRTLRSGISGEQVDDSSRATEYRVFGV
jgi:hypothetical protein